MPRLRGTVVDEQQQPVAGAHVRIEPPWQNVTTEADGTFALDVTGDQTHRVWAHKDDRYAWFVQWRADDDGDAPVVLRLQLGVTFIARVFADRAPVAGATLRLEHGIKATTDADGCLTVTGLAPTHYSGDLVADGQADEQIAVIVHEDPGGVIEQYITMQPGAKIAGNVVDPDNAPIADALVQAIPLDGRRYYQAWTDADGTWQLRARPGTYRVIARSEQHGSSEDLTLECDGGARTDVVLRLGSASVEAKPAPARMAGVVLHADGTPAPKLDVHIIGAYGCYTDARGRFETAPSEAETADHEAIVRGLGRGRMKCKPMRIRVGQTDVRLAFDKGAVVAGRVLLDGKPVPYFGLRVLTENLSPIGGPVIGIRATDGRFVLRHISPGTRRIAVVTASTRIATSAEFVVTSDERIDIGDIELVRGQPLEGYVRDRAGAAVAGARVMIGRMSLAELDHQSVLDRLTMGHYETRTDATGRYVFEGLELRRIALEETASPEIIWATHFREGTSPICELPPSATTFDLTVLGFARIEGVVEGRARADRPHVWVTRVDEPPPCGRLAMCNDSGRFERDNIAPGEYTVELGDEKAVSERVVVGEDETAHVKLVSSGQADPPPPGAPTISVGIADPD